MFPMALLEEFHFVLILLKGGYMVNHNDTTIYAVQNEMPHHRISFEKRSIVGGMSVLLWYIFMYLI